MNKEIFKFTGVLNRSTWWAVAIPLALVNLMLEAVLQDPEGVAIVLIVAAMSIGLTYVHVAINKARLNDAGWSGWWMLCPVVNLVVMGFFRSEKK